MYIYIYTHTHIGKLRSSNFRFLAFYTYWYIFGYIRAGWAVETFASTRGSHPGDLGRTEKGGRQTLWRRRLQGLRKYRKTKKLDVKGYARGSGEETGIFGRMRSVRKPFYFFLAIAVQLFNKNSTHRKKTERAWGSWFEDRKGNKKQEKVDVTKHSTYSMEREAKFGTAEDVWSCGWRLKHSYKLREPPTAGTVLLFCCSVVQSFQFVLIKEEVSRNQLIRQSWCKVHGTSRSLWNNWECLNHTSMCSHCSGLLNCMKS